MKKITKSSKTSPQKFQALTSTIVIQTSSWISFSSLNREVAMLVVIAPTIEDSLSIVRSSTCSILQGNVLLNDSSLLSTRLTRPFQHKDTIQPTVLLKLHQNSMLGPLLSIASKYARSLHRAQHKWGCSNKVRRLRNRVHVWKRQYQRWLRL